MGGSGCLHTASMCVWTTANESAAEESRGKHEITTCACLCSVCACVYVCVCKRERGRSRHDGFKCVCEGAFVVVICFGRLIFSI